MTVTRIGFAYNPTIEAAVELSARAAGWCQMRGIDHWQAQSGDLDVLLRELPTTDALVVLGGDGTFLRAVRALAEVDVPILGINLGKVGFLSKAEAGELEAVLDRIVDGRVRIDERMALEGRILRGGDRSTPARSPSTTSSSRAARLPGSAGSTSSIDGTAPRDVHRRRPGRREPDRLHRLFVLGRRSILDPVSRNLVVTPIAAYLSAIRSVVVSPGQTVHCRVVDAHEALVSVDGRDDIPIAAR